MTARAEAVRVRRGFADVEEGQVHFREAGVRTPDKPTLVLMHASPGSAKTLEPMLRAMGASRHVVAPDTLGNGDSSAPASDVADIAYFADAHLRALDAMGIERFDLYGTHTGANIACEIAIRRPERVRSLILDGIGLYGEEEQADLLRHYIPAVRIDDMGSQLHTVWNFVRDAYLFWPWYRKTATARRDIGLPDAEVLHDKVVEVLKAARTFHVPYRAALSYDKRQRIPLIGVRTLLTCGRQDMLYEYLDALGGLLPDAKRVPHDGMASAEAGARTLAMFEAFLD